MTIAAIYYTIKYMNKKSFARDIVYIAIFVVLMVIFTLFVSIPFFPVPLTFQTVICVMAGLLLGAKRAGLSMFIYVFMGLVLAIPVFSGGKGGPGMTLRKANRADLTFGYIIAFIPTAAAAGAVRGKLPTASLKRYITAATAAFFVCYAIGIPYFLIIWRFYMGNTDIWQAALTFNILYMPKDLILCLAAAFLSKKLAPVLFSRE